MLVLSRKVGEELVVPECGLVITVLENRGGTVRLGITAPSEVSVYRREVWERIQAVVASEAAATGPTFDVQPVKMKSNVPLRSR